MIDDGEPKEGTHHDHGSFNLLAAKCSAANSPTLYYLSIDSCVALYSWFPELFIICFIFYSDVDGVADYSSRNVNHIHNTE